MQNVNKQYDICVSIIQIRENWKQTKCPAEQGMGSRARIPGLESGPTT